MTILCGGGASAARPSFGLGVSVGVAEVAALFNNVPTPAALAAAAAIGVINYELSTFCNADPPPMPVLGASDYFDLFGGSGVLAQIAAIDKFRDAIGNILWPTFCECSTSSTPLPPSWPTPPANLPTYQPPQLAPSGPQPPCWKATQTFDSSIGFGTFGDPKLNALLWQDQTSTTAGTASRKLPLPLPSQLEIEAIPHGSGANPATQAWTEIEYNDASGVALRIDQSSPQWSADSKVISIPPADAVFVTFFAFPANASLAAGTGTLDVTITMLCANQSIATPATPCCPPDPTLEAELQAIRSMLALIYQGLPSVPHSYSSGAVHSSLSGNGTITLAGAPLAVRVDIAVDPATLGVDLGNPNLLFDRGYIVPVVNAAPIRQENRLVYNPQLFLLPALTDQVGYSLHSGVTIAITEINRGP